MGKKETIDSWIYGEKGKTWERSLINVLRCFSQGKDFGVKGTDIIYFIPQSKIP